MTLKINHHRDPHSFTVSSSSRWRSQTDSLGRRRGRIAIWNSFRNVYITVTHILVAKTLPRVLSHWVGSITPTTAPFTTLFPTVWGGYPSGERRVEVTPQRQRPTKDWSSDSTPQTYTTPGGTKPILIFLRFRICVRTCFLQFIWNL